MLKKTRKGFDGSRGEDVDWLTCEINPKKKNVLNSNVWNKSSRIFFLI